MHRTKYRPATYVLLLTLTFFFTIALVVALISGREAPPDPDRALLGDDAPRAPALQPPGVVGEHRTAVIAASSAGLGLMLTLLSLSGGVKYIDRSNVLKSAVRRDMYEYVRAHPGVYLRELSRVLALNPTNTTWHLRKLVEAELVRCQLVNGLKVYYPVEGGVAVKKQAVANSVLKNDNARTILSYLLARPGAHQREMARALGVNHGTVRWHLRKMVEAEIVSELRDGSLFKYFLSPDGLERASRLVGVEPHATPDTVLESEQVVAPVAAPQETGLTSTT